MVDTAVTRALSERSMHRCCSVTESGGTSDQEASEGIGRGGTFIGMTVRWTGARGGSFARVISSGRT